MGYLKKPQLARKGGYYNIEFKPMGKWEETLKVTGKMGTNIKAASIAAQMKVVTTMVKKVKAHLRNQDLNWPPLNPAYEEAKNRYGLDPRILWSHGTYYNAITVWSKGQGHMVFGGVKKGVYAQSMSGKKRAVEIARIAAIHEFASGKKIPRRPLWNPTIQEMGGKEGLKIMFMGSFLYWLRRFGVPAKPFRDLL